jgi:NTP pyrophosphatase (non-canonical NTP hydrolase)
MFISLLSDLRQFVIERDWMQYHSPQNMATTLHVETTELLEHFLPDAKISQKELENELGDLLHCILLTMDALKIEPPASLKPYHPSHPLALELSIKLRAFMSHFLWLRPNESYRGTLSELSILLEELLLIHFELCKQLKVDPIEATYQKLELNRKKYPVDLMLGSVDNYFERKKTLKQKELL